MSRYSIKGFMAGIMAGITYGLNPLFAKPLLESGAEVYAMLLWRYILAIGVMYIFLRISGYSLKIRRKEVVMLALIGTVFSLSSVFLFASYSYIASGLATTMVYLYPAFTALILIMMGKIHSWQVLASVATTFIGVCLMTDTGDVENANPTLGMTLAAFSALCYAIYIILVNHNRHLKEVSPQTLTFYSLVFGTITLSMLVMANKCEMFSIIDSWVGFGNLMGLSLVPTMISMLAVAVSTRIIGATRTAVLGVFEPITAIIVGSVIFSESLTQSTYLGIAVCILAVTFMIVHSKHKESSI